MQVGGTLIVLLNFIPPEMGSNLGVLFTILLHCNRIIVLIILLSIYSTTQQAATSKTVSTAKKLWFLICGLLLFSPIVSIGSLVSLENKKWLWKM
jgi:hypothetical protein